MKKLVYLALLCASAWAQIDVMTTRRRAEAPAGTTVTYQNYCDGSNNEAVGTCTLAGTPSAGNAVVGIVWMAQGGTLTSVCDGTGTGGCTGSSTYTINPKYSNGSAFASYTFYTCNYSGSSHLSLTFDTSRSYYVVGVYASGNSTSSCSDGYNKAQGTSAGTAHTSGTITTANANSLLVGLVSNDSGGTYTAGVDGQGNNYTARANKLGVVMVETRTASATNTYSASATGPNAVWNAEIIAIK